MSYDFFGPDRRRKQFAFQGSDKRVMQKSDIEIEQEKIKAETERQRLLIDAEERKEDRKQAREFAHAARLRPAHEGSQHLQHPARRLIAVAVGVCGRLLLRHRDRIDSGSAASLRFRK